MLGAIAALAVVVVGYGSVRWYKISHYPVWFATVKVGDDAQTVISKMGSPDDVQTRPHWLWCTAPGCYREFHYGHAIPPEWWVVGFDTSGHVIWTDELQSP